MSVAKELLAQSARRSPQPGDLVTYRCQAAPSSQHTSRLLRVATMRGGFVGAQVEGCHRWHAVTRDRVD